MGALEGQIEAVPNLSTSIAPKRASIRCRGSDVVGQSTLIPIDSTEKPTSPVPPALAANAGVEGIR